MSASDQYDTDILILVRAPGRTAAPPRRRANG